jgi:hypothetical protein
VRRRLVGVYSRGHHPIRNARIYEPCKIVSGPPVTAVAFIWIEPGVVTRIKPLHRAHAILAGRPVAATTCVVF